MVNLWKTLENLHRLPDQTEDLWNLLNSLLNLNIKEDAITKSIARVAKFTTSRKTYQNPESKSLSKTYSNQNDMIE